MNQSLELKSKDLRDHYADIKLPNDYDPDRFYTFRWLKQNDMILFSKDPNNVNFKFSMGKPRATSMTGGTIFFTSAHIDEFFKKIAIDFTSEKPSPNYFNQMAFDTKEEGCRLAFDIDSNRLLNNGEIGCIMMTIRKTLQSYYTDFNKTPLPIFCSINGPRIKKKKASVGVHIVVPLKVKVSEARQITAGFKIRLQAKAGKNEFNLTDIEVDSSIYKDTYCNLRPLGSSKIEPCPMCDGVAEATMACQFCDGRGRMMSKHTYQPFACLSPQGKDDPNYFKEQHSDWFTILKNHSIWSTPNEERQDYCKPDSDPSVESLKNTKQSNENIIKSVFSAKQRSNVSCLTSHDESYDMITEFLQDCNVKGQQPWKNIVVSEIRTTGGSRHRMALIIVKGPGSSNCMIAEKDHGQNIFFKLTTNHMITQGCHSDKHGCKGTNTIQFEVPGFITNKVFRLQGPPKHRVYRKRIPKKSDRREVEEFLKKRNTNSELRAANILKLQKDARGTELKEFYNSL